ncbi:hypothetical protein [Bacillus sp. SG-1]|uniref:hypothetical protein n=1 Tax=Bacillus sp. SG-1 TaxID=161544 RepID=UPI0002DA141A|nr:hypothetical protein [Bacillus sp. SG-1]
MEIIIVGISFLFILLGFYFVIKKAVEEGINSSREIRQLKRELRLLNKKLNKEGTNKINMKI